jgi:hypothetical protein
MGKRLKCLTVTTNGAFPILNDFLLSASILEITPVSSRCGLKPDPQAIKGS